MVTLTLDNLVLLTAREHFICHLLLVKITEGQANIKMAHAAWAMCVRKTSNKRTYKITSRTYSVLREKHAAGLASLAGPDHPNKGRKTGRTAADFTDEWKANISAAKKGTTSGKNNAMFGRTHSAESRKKISESRKANQMILTGMLGLRVAKKRPKK